MSDRVSLALAKNLTVTEQLVSPVTQELLAYWQEKRGERAYPAWTDLNLMDIYRIAPDVVVRDVVDGGQEFLCRFSGTVVSAVLGVEGTGKRICEAYSPHATELIISRYRPILDGHWPLRFVGYIQAVEKNLPTGFEVVYLPLGDAEGRIGHVIAAYDFTYVPTPEEVPPPDMSC